MSLIVDEFRAIACKPAPQTQSEHRSYAVTNATGQTQREHPRHRASTEAGHKEGLGLRVFWGLGLRVLGLGLRV